MAMEQAPDSKYAVPPAEIQPADELSVADKEVNNNIRSFNPEELKQIKEKVDERAADKLLLEKISAGGKLDPSNPAEVAAAMRIIKKETGRTAVLGSEDLQKLNQQNPASAEKAFVNNVADAVTAATTKEQVRVADALSEAQERGPNGVLFSKDKVFTAEETFSRDEAGQAVERQGALDAELQQNPEVALRRDRRVVVQLEGSSPELRDARPESYQVVNRVGDKVTLMRYANQYAADGKTMTDPSTWKAVIKEVTVAEFLKRGGRLAE